MSVTPPKTHHHFAAAVRFSPKILKREMAAVSGFNAKLAVLITGAVGTMAMAYFFTVVALISLPAILIQAGAIQAHSVPTFLTKPGLILIVSWFAQTLTQLVLLAIILVGQDVQAKAADARAESTYRDTESLLDKLDLKTAGGIADLRDEIAALLKPEAP